MSDRKHVDQINPWAQKECDATNHGGERTKEYLRGMLVGIHSTSLSWSVGESLGEVSLCVDDHTQAHESSLLPMRVAGPPVYRRALSDF